MEKGIHIRLKDHSYLQTPLDSYEKPVGVFLDVLKDPIDHHFRLTNFFMAIQNRTQQMQIGKIKSDKTELNYGISQGTLLGSTLFALLLSYNLGQKFKMGPALTETDSKVRYATLPT